MRVGSAGTDQVVAQRRRVVGVSEVGLSLLHRLHAAVDGPHQGLLSVTLTTTTTTNHRHDSPWRSFLVSMSFLCGLQVAARHFAGGSAHFLKFIITFKLTLGSLCAFSR